MLWRGLGNVSELHSAILIQVEHHITQCSETGTYLVGWALWDGRHFAPPGPLDIKRLREGLYLLGGTLISAEEARAGTFKLIFLGRIQSPTKLFDFCQGSAIAGVIFILEGEGLVSGFYKWASTSRGANLPPTTQD